MNSWFYAIFERIGEREFGRRCAMENPVTPIDGIVEAILFKQLTFHKLQSLLSSRKATQDGCFLRIIWVAHGSANSVATIEESHDEPCTEMARSTSNADKVRKRGNGWGDSRSHGNGRQKGGILTRQIELRRKNIEFTTT